jgi:hypothetical protein
MIPKILHYVWVGGPMPPSQKAYLESWRTTNPDYRIMAWTEENIDFRIPLIAEAYRRKRWATVSDVVRLMAVYEHGGIYLDTDFMLFRSLDPLLKHDCFFSFQEEEPSSDWVANGVFGAVQGHWFIEKASTRQLTIPRNPFGLEKPTKYGPKLITHLLRSHGLDRYDRKGMMVQGIHVCPTTVFFPFHWTEEFNEDCIRPETVGAHFWEKSWRHSLPKPVRVLHGAASWLRNGHRHAVATAK